MRKQNKLDLLNFFKTSDFFNTKFINRTKKRLIEVITQNLVTMSEKELINFYEEFLSKNEFKFQEAELYLKTYDTQNERTSK
jgi:hypothetical protein